MTLKQHTVRANGLDFPVLEAGDGPLVLCLHGFPDHARSWTDLIERLAKEGYRAVAPAMRGYWPDGRAPDGCYQSWATGGDAVALIEALGSETAVVIGHDWGAAAAYAAANLAPERINKLITMAVPYGPQIRAAFMLDGDQQRRSWYMFFFQTPMAVMAAGANDFAFIDRLWAEWSPGYVLPDADRVALKAMFAHPGVLEETLGYYRQLFGGPEVKPEWAETAAKLGGPISMPALYLHGRNDGCMGVGLLDGMEDQFPAGLRKVVMEDAGHFLQLEQPQRVAEEIIGFLKIGI
ncbi:alpha/beta fold hydrolase [Phenylobacterium sp.]|uniref:alpha/beta fold hydrolase n=1 Tax=Phenylobacterium sp. TaxID=1871053 RepID=UPI002733C8FF|nr:alpha/beta hydrolase [Phenylobacterium sp.]MDP3852408.1 alpha/beta hydrolase [Phenylobacterium sp.]